MTDLKRFILLVAAAMLLGQAMGHELSFEKAHDLKPWLEIGMRKVPFELAHDQLKGQLDSGTGHDGWVECWNALYELRSCTNQIVLFFLNGEAYLGPDCCWAVCEVTHNCWPSMMVTVGFTQEEGDILRGYCDASAPPSLGPVAPGMVV